MKILILANKVPYPPTDGGAIATQSMIVGLANSGAQVTVVAISTPKHPTTPNQLPQWLTRTARFHIVHVNTSINPLAALANLLFSRMPYNARRFVNRRVAEKIAEVLKAESFDLIQLEGLYMAPYMSTARKHSGAPIALRAHNVEFEIWERTAAIARNPLKRWYLNLLARRVKRMEIRCLQGIDLLVAISERDESMLKRMGFGGHSITSQTGLDTVLHLPCPAGQPANSVFHLGGLDWIPNQEGLFWFLANCWGKVLRSVSNATFYIAGRNAPSGFVTEILKHPNVVYCGEVPSSREFICSKGIMVVPLLSGSGMRIKIVEGMLLGKAIVSTPIGAEGIEAENGTHMLIANGAEEFAGRVIECLSNPRLAEALGAKARLFATERFDNNSICSELLRFYRSVTGK